MFPQQLIKARESAGWTRHQLAMELGVTTETVCAWENGVRLPGLENRYLLGEMLGLTDIPEPVRAERPLRGQGVVATTVYLRPDQLQGLRTMAAERGVAVAELVREAVDIILGGSA